MIAVLVLVALLPSSSAWALSKATQKGLFAAALVGLGILVQHRIASEQEETARRLRSVEEAWGPPRYALRYQKGWDRIELRVYQWDHTRLVFALREGRIVYAVRTGSPWAVVDAAPGLQLREQSR
ncbi:MAG: hypothetical protein KatS3mg115_1621 [Candidatus Poribacteria bacterium]|nr:MAG: hypothetical protein KatS3mg115_1621 [Candidatus Poribacteria bacterium]